MLWFRSLYFCTLSLLFSCGNENRFGQDLDLPSEELSNLQKTGELKDTSFDFIKESVSARLPNKRRTKVEIFVFKKPEISTYYYRSKKGGVRGIALQILVLAVDGRLTLAAYTSTGDPTRRAYNKTKKQYVNGSETTTGSYSVEFLCRACKSAGYGNASMNYSVFFLGSKFAIHETSKSYYGKLGQKASMGCVRLNTFAAKTVFETVKSAASYNDVTINILDSGVLNHFQEEEILNALSQNFQNESEQG